MSLCSCVPAVASVSLRRRALLSKNLFLCLKIATRFKLLCIVEGKNGITKSRSQV